MPELFYSSSAPVRPEDLQTLFQQTDWAANRTLDQIEHMLTGTYAYVGVWLEAKLIGFGRAVSDGVFRAFIEDVIVDSTWRGQGIGDRIMRHLLEQLNAVEEIVLCCHDDLVSFYARYGFAAKSMPHLNIWRGK